MEKQPPLFWTPSIIFVSSFLFLSAQQTALHWSAFYNRPEHVRLLIKHDSNIGIPDSEGKIPLHWAAHSQEPSATQTVRCILVHTIALTHTQVNLSSSPRILIRQSACFFFFFSADVCVRLWRKQLPLSPYWTGRTMRGGRPCTLPLLTVTRQWWRCWRLTRAVTWQLMITSSERRCTGQLCSVGEHTSCIKPWRTATHGSFQLCGNVKFFPKQNEVENFYTN